MGIGCGSRSATVTKLFTIETFHATGSTSTTAESPLDSGLEGWSSDSVEHSVTLRKRAPSHVETGGANSDALLVDGQGEACDPTSAGDENLTEGANEGGEA